MVGCGWQEPKTVPAGVYTDGTVLDLSDSPGERASERFRLQPLQHCLFPPELQWQPGGEVTNLTGVRTETPGPGLGPLSPSVLKVTPRANCLLTPGSQ